MFSTHRFYATGKVQSCLPFKLVWFYNVDIIILFKSDISELEHTRESMARELVNVSVVSSELEEKCKELPELQAKHQVTFTLIKVKVISVA